LRKQHTVTITALFSKPLKVLKKLSGFLHYTRSLKHTLFLSRRAGGATQRFIAKKQVAYNFGTVQNLLICCMAHWARLSVKRA